MTDLTLDQLTNRAPADRLADIRAQIAVLKGEEAALRAGFVSGDLPLDGDEYTVTIETKLNQRLDLKSMREHVEESIWTPFLISKPTTYVTTRRREPKTDLKTRGRIHT
ncbi:hypothetical protein [Bradyrhizobium japonicum]|uniref:hypothetical protein n=1 Tax=Bradyrhizobium japonicum TaxID=375 RepID=UPI001BA69505|nr:hypothetical protein [Bradyrhizobium japonicum]MBR0910803.1 hypothetical protein [Bradyrhizobium japonicum]